MRQIYYTIRTLLRERGSNIIRIISLSLGLTIGILLFSQIAFELSYEQCYPEAERLALVRCQRINLSTGETAGDDKETSYDYTVFDVLASTLAEEMPKEVEVASSVLSIWSARCRLYLCGYLFFSDLRHTGVARQSQGYDYARKRFCFGAFCP